MEKDFHLEARYHYSLLPDKEKAYYRTLIRRLADHELTLPQNEDSTIDIYKVFEAVRWDFPEFYHISYGDVCLHFDENETLSFRIETEIRYTEAEFRELNARLDAILHRFDGILDPFEIELAAYQYAIENFEYEENHESLPKSEWSEIFTLAGLLRRGRGVCAAFARFVQFILQQRGIMTANLISEAKTEEGEGGEGNALHHSWLAVRIDGEFYHLDVTMDEGDEKDPEIFPYSHFNITDEEAAADHILNADEYPGIVCRATAANYYVRRGLYFTTDDAVIEALRRFARENEPTEKEILYFYFRMPPGHLREGLDERLVRDLRGYSSARWVQLAADPALGRFYVALGYRAG